VFAARHLLRGHFAGGVICFAVIRFAVIRFAVIGGHFSKENSNRN
jgi:hypothetical protein